MSLDAKLDQLSQNAPYAGSAVVAGSSILTFNQWMGILGLLVSIAFGLATFWFNVQIQKRRERREIELHRKRMESGYPPSPKDSQKPKSQ